MIPRDEILLFDGATGTELERRGADLSLPLWSARVLIDAPELLSAVHQAYLEAGAQAITSNTFRTHQRSLAKAGLGDQATKLTRSAAAIAIEARNSINPSTLVLGSVAPLEDCYRPDLAPAADVCAHEHGAIMHALIEAGVDGLMIETMCAAHELRAAAEVAQAIAPGRWGLCYTGRPDQPGVLLCGTPVSDLIDTLEHAAFIGINCVAATTLQSHVSHARAIFDDAIPIAAFGNVGYATPEGAWISTDAVEPERFAGYAADWLSAGATIIGGCCGTTPDTTAAMADMIDSASAQG
ncbi:MAG: homocysteine S-methyltransferase family protein [Phycisphaerales bacterium]|nr:homocysteine S-methyltransferase family protein [Phycisphaerales bacterium]